VLQENQSNNIHQEFGSEVDVEQITGRKRRTLQKDRCSGRGFPFYRVGRKILYDLSEVRELIRAARVDTAGAVTPSRDTAGAALKGVRL
jgi:hypothetical protein